MEIQAQVIDYLEANKDSEIYTSLCSCGAITVSNYANRDEVSCMAERVPFIKPTSDIVMSACNHCVNDWGLDSEPEDEGEDED